ncbi:hypothetical protein QC764_100400 [Podospora pseudoanserina]|uniref:Uncharacterized protein n=1 Tax=Podospora pseudoanserina TaxID=2609844 RepID=A0ABR0IKJ9_9PEZI|nr:hypothetical protein QC764_100400 [Podospora pseudoanserina]
MALQDNLVRDALLKLAQDDMPWDKTGEAVVWRRIFTAALFKIPSMASQSWMIDGVDEFSCFGFLFSKKFLATIPHDLHLFATSRLLEDIERGFLSLGRKKATIEKLSDTDTVENMHLFLDTRLKDLGRPDNPQDRERMCEKIFAKSRGSFLWTRLVVQEFEDVW